MSRHWRMLITACALADGVYRLALRPRLRRALGVQMPLQLP